MSADDDRPAPSTGEERKPEIRNDSSDADTDGTRNEATDNQWITDHGFNLDETYVKHLGANAYFLLQEYGEQYLATILNRNDDGVESVETTTVNYSSGEWYESEQNVRTYANNVGEDVPNVHTDNVKDAILDAANDLATGAGDDLFGADLDGLDLDVDALRDDDLSWEDLYRRTDGRPRRYYSAGTERMEIDLQVDDPRDADATSETRRINLEGSEWHKEDGNTAAPAVKAKAEAALDVIVDISWEDWQLLKRAWRRDAKTEIEKHETDMDYLADSVTTRLSAMIRATPEKEAVLNEEENPVVWWDAEHTGKVAPDGAERKPISDDEPIVWVWTEDLRTAAESRGEDMDRNKMSKLSQALLRKDKTVRTAWKTSINGVPARLIPFRASKLGIEETDVAGNGDDDRILPSGDESNAGADTTTDNDDDTSEISGDGADESNTTDNEETSQNTAGAGNAADANGVNPAGSAGLDVDTLRSVYHVVDQLDTRGDDRGADASEVAGRAARDHDIDPGVTAAALAELGISGLDVIYERAQNTWTVGGRDIDDALTDYDRGDDR